MPRFPGCRLFPAPHYSQFAHLIYVRDFELRIRNPMPASLNLIAGPNLAFNVSCRANADSIIARRLIWRSFYPH